jgi:hypothetical protein
MAGDWLISALKAVSSGPTNPGCSGNCTMITKSCHEPPSHRILQQKRMMRGLVWRGGINVLSSVS